MEITRRYGITIRTLTVHYTFSAILTLPYLTVLSKPK